MLRADFYRAFHSAGFLIGAFATLGIFFFGYVGMGASSAVAAFNNDLKYNNINKLLFLCSAFAYSASFCTDWQTRFTVPLIVRSGKRSYTLSKCVAVAVAGGTSVVTGTAAFIAFVCATHEQILPSAVEIDNEFSYQAFGDLLVNGQPALFFLCYLLVLFLAAGFFSSLGLAASGFLPNKYVAYISPFALGFVLNQLANKLGLPIWLDPNMLATARILNSTTPAILRMAAVSFLSFTVLCDILFIQTAERRLANG